MTIEVFKTNENPFGLSYEDHIKNYWKFTCKIPKDRNPAIDNNGQRDEIANQNSNAPVFYLNSSDKGDDQVERRCRVPAGKGIFIPVIGVEVSELEVENASVNDLKRIAKKDQDSASDLSAKLDGNEVSNIRGFRTSTNEFQLEFPDNPLFGNTPGTGRAVAEGIYLITRPLTPGTHTIEVKGKVDNNNEPTPIQDPQFSVNIRYTLEVQ